MPLLINNFRHGLTHTHTDDLCRINFKKPGVRRPVASKHLVLKIKDSLAWEQLGLYTITNDDKIFAFSMSVTFVL